MFRSIIATFTQLRITMALNAIADRWRRAGAPLPRATAMREVHLRAHLESFRDFASTEYLAGHDLIDNIKARWIETVLKPMGTALGVREFRMLKSIVQDMPVDEMLHRGAYTAWCDEADRITMENLARSKSLYGPSGLPPNALRVLLGKA